MSVHDAAASVARETTRARVGAMLLAVSVLGVGCDFEVTNPGPIADEFLDAPGAHASLVGGVSRELSRVMGVMAQDVGIRTREIHATGTYPFEGVTFDAHMGRATDEPPGTLNIWGFGHRARWMAEDAIRRLGEVLDEASYSSNPHAAEAHLWAGYANRLLGEYYCEAAFDRGPAEPGESFHVRAEELFSEAIRIGSTAGAEDVVTAARAGRASVRVHLGDWSGAVQDAASVSTDFEFVLPYSEEGGLRYRNAFAQYHISYTVWNTFYEDYFATTGDPRTPWEVDADQPTQEAGLSPWPEIPRLLQLKYPATTSPIRLSGGGEMRLIEAEALLREGDVGGALALVNDLRERAGVDPRPTPSSEEEAWTALKSERGIELWLEGRRLSDFRRWDAEGTPGMLTDYELGITNDGPGLQDRALCMPIPLDEQETNPNL